MIYNKKNVAAEMSDAAQAAPVGPPMLSLLLLSLLYLQLQNIVHSFFLYK
jgi:hypothetical protein